MSLNCPRCDAISLQRVTTQQSYCDVTVVEKITGKKPYRVRCRKCGREWKTNAEYARVLSGDAYRITK